MLALLVFGSIQACNLIYLKHAITSAAYEGTLELCRSDSTNDTVTTRINQVLTTHNLANTTVTIEPPGTMIQQLPKGAPVGLKVQIDVKANLPLSGWFPTPNFLDYTVTGPR